MLKYLLEKGLLHGDCLTVTGTSNGRCPALPCPALPCPALPCPALLCSALLCSALSCSVLLCLCVKTPPCCLCVCLCQCLCLCACACPYVHVFSVHACAVLHCAHCSAHVPLFCLLNVDNAHAFSCVHSSGNCCKIVAVDQQALRKASVAADLEVAVLVIRSGCALLMQP